MSRPPDQRGWRPFAWFLLRATGFPLTLLEGLADPAPPDAADWPEALRRTRARLADVLDRDDVAEALFMSNPDLAPRLASWRRTLRGERRNAADRARERTLYRYLGRFCAKNETTSFFGASALGRWDGDPLEGPLPLARARSIFVEQWVAQALLSRAAAELETEGAWLERPRRAPSTGVDAAGVARHAARAGDAWLAEVARVEGAAATALLGAADGSLTRAELVASAAAGSPAVEVEATLADLEDKGLLLSSRVLPNGVPQVLAHAGEVLEAQPPGATRDLWRGRLRALREAADRFGELRGAGDRGAAFEAIEASLTGWLGESPRRHAGEHYASRTALHEKADRSAARVGPPPGLASALREPLSTLLDLSLLPLCADRMTFRAWFEQTFGRDVEQPWGEVCRTLDRTGPRFLLASPPEALAARRALRALRDELAATVDAHLAERGAGVPMALPAERIAEALQPFGAMMADDGVAFANPDLMPWVGPAGEAAAVLGEAHDQVLLSPSLYPAAPDRAEVYGHTAELLAALAAPARPALVVRRRAAFMAWAPDLGCVALELDADSGLPPDRRAPLAELRVRLTGSGLRFRVTTHAGERVDVLPLTHGRRTTLAARVFPVLPLDLAVWLGQGAPWRLPRLTLGALTLHRRQFRVPSEAWAGEADAVRAQALLQEAAAGLPRFVFTRPPGEPKPLVIDLANPCALELLRHEARRAESLTLVEMLPAPGQLWLGGPEGEHTAELRTVLFRGGDGLPHLLDAGWRGDGGP